MYTRVELFSYKTNSEVENCNLKEGNIPDYPMHVYQAVGTVIDGKVTVCGGAPLQSGPITNQCFQLDDVSAEWKPFKSLLFPRANSGSAIVDQGWWVLGGNNVEASNSSEIYKDGIWKTGPSIPSVLDYWNNKPCIVNLNRTHTIVIGGNVNRDQHTTWMYNWAASTWTIQDFVPLIPTSCIPFKMNGNTNVLVGYDRYYAIFDVSTGRWGAQVSVSGCSFQNLLLVNDVPVILTPGNQHCHFNGTHWIRSSSIFQLDYPRNYYLYISGFNPIQSKTCQSNVIFVTGQSSQVYTPSIEVFSIDVNKGDCQLSLPPFPLQSSNFDIALFLYKSQISGCDNSNCYSLNKNQTQWVRNSLGLQNFIWASVESTNLGLWKIGGGAQQSTHYYCYQSPHQATYCILQSYSRVFCFLDKHTIEGPRTPHNYRMFGHCTVNINSTHTLIAGGLQSNTTNQCTSSPFGTADSYCKSKLSWLVDWRTEEWTRIQDLPRDAAFASCAKVEISGKKYVFLYGHEENQPSRNGTVQLWSFDTETWSADVPQPSGNFRSLPSVVSVENKVYLISGKTSFNQTYDVNLSDTIQVFSEGVWTNFPQKLYRPRQKAAALAVPRSALPACTKKEDLTKNQAEEKTWKTLYNFFGF